MKRAIITLVVISMLLSLTGVLTAQDVKKQGGDWVAKIEKSFRVSGAGSLEMKKIAGSVKIIAWDKSEVLIKETKRMDIYSEKEAQTAVDMTDESYLQEGNTITIGGLAFSKKWISSKFVINVPADFNIKLGLKGGGIKVSGLNGNVKAFTGGGAISLSECGGNAFVETGGGEVFIGGEVKEVEVKTGGGAVNVINANGEKVTVNTGGGEINIKGSSGEIVVETGGGAINIINASASIKAETGGGEINCVNVGGEVEVSTGGGELNLTGIKGAISGSTGGGEINAEIVMADFKKNHAISLSTGGGAIYLVIPAKLPATIEAKTVYDIDRKESKIISDFKLNITKKESGDMIKVKGIGDINGGGDTIKLSTGGGHITIKKK